MDRDRKAAAGILIRVEKDGAFSNILLNDVLAKEDISSPAFVRELVYGTLKRKYYLDHYIGKLSSRGIKSIDAGVLALLRTALYQIIFMSGVPDHAAVDESVDIAKVMFPKAAGFVNGFLRNFIRKREELEGPEEIKKPVKRMSVLYSCDQSLAKMLCSGFGEKEAEAFLASSCETAPVYIRVNLTRTDVPELTKELESGGIDVTPLSGLSGVLEVKGRDIVATRAFQDGKFFIQDASSGYAIEMLGPEPGESVLDVCAAPGGKSFTAAILMGNSGSVLSKDVYPQKLDLIKSSADRLGLSIIEVREGDALIEDESLTAGFDKVICDVPCTGTGVIRRKPEIKYRKLEDNKELYEKQFKILSTASGYLKTGGKLLYSTCTVDRRENSDITERFLSMEPGFRKVAERLFLPEKDGTDGFYACVMEKTEESKRNA